MAQILTFAAYLLSISAFPIWGTSEYDFLCFDVTLNTTLIESSNVVSGDYTHCFSLEVIKNQLDSRQTSEDWMIESIVATSFGILSVLFGFFALSLLLSGICIPITTGRLQFVLAFLICAMFCQILTFLLATTKVCDAYLIDVECVSDNGDRSIETGGIISLVALFCYLCAFAASCIHHQKLWNNPKSKTRTQSRSAPVAPTTDDDVEKAVESESSASDSSGSDSDGDSDSESDSAEESSETGSSSSDQIS
jgi:hypothetical protein